MLAPDYQTPQRMAAKRQAVPLPDLAGKRVLDIGCDMAAWCRIASEAGAVDVLGLDRNRVVRGQQTDLIAANRAQGIPNARFEQINLGREWREFGRFDVILCLSMYHHWFEQCGDHRPIWLWLWRHCRSSGQVLWEGPVDDGDPVVRANVSAGNRAGYSLDAILAAASHYFTPEHIGPAMHEPTRQVWRFRPLAVDRRAIGGEMRKGMGGATKAFEFADGRRIAEIERALGWRPIPGSLNVMLDQPFGWADGYYRAQILDATDRSKGFASDWAPRWARFYPVQIDGEDAVAMRFEGEVYDPCFMELIAPWRLRDMIAGPRVTISR